MASAEKSAKDKGVRRPGNRKGPPSPRRPDPETGRSFARPPTGSPKSLGTFLSRPQSGASEGSRATDPGSTRGPSSDYRALVRKGRLGLKTCQVFQASNFWFVFYDRVEDNGITGERIKLFLCHCTSLVKKFLDKSFIL